MRCINLAQMLYKYTKRSNSLGTRLNCYNEIGGGIMGKKKKFHPDELAGFCSQIAVVLKSGTSLEEGIYMLAEEVEEGATKKILEQIEQDLRDSESFCHALENTKAFPAYFIDMVNIGEKSGKLEQVMFSLAEYYERECMIQDSIRNVIAYPLLMFVMIGIILLALVGKILPMFQKVFRNLNVDVASSSNQIMQFGMWTGRIVAGFSIVVLVVAIALILWYRTEKGKEVLKSFSGRFFVTRKTANLLATGRFISSMSIMISSGMDTEQAMELAKNVTGQPALKKKLERCMDQVKEQNSLADALREEKILTGMQGRMVSVAAKSGMLEEVFADVSRQHDEQISNQLGRFCTRMETGLVLALSLIVGGVLISIMFPLVSIITSIG